MPLRTELHPHPRSLLVLSPKQAAVRFLVVAFSIPQGAPIESDQSVESSSFRRANSFRSSNFTQHDRTVGIEDEAIALPTHLVE
jgi:hypothetical protein